MADVHDQAGRRMVRRGDKVGGQPEVRDVGERERFQRHSGPHLDGLDRELVGRTNMRLAYQVIIQAQGTIVGPIESLRSPIHIVTPHNLPILPG